MIQSVEQEGSWVLPQFSWVLPQVLIVLEHVKISSMGYASVISLGGKQSTFSKYTQSALMHRPFNSLSSFFRVYYLVSKCMGKRVADQSAIDTALAAKDFVGIITWSLVKTVSFEKTLS